MSYNFNANSGLSTHENWEGWPPLDPSEQLTFPNELLDNDFDGYYPSGPPSIIEDWSPSEYGFHNSWNSSLASGGFGSYSASPATLPSVGTSPTIESLPYGSLNERLIAESTDSSFSSVSLATEHLGSWAEIPPQTSPLIGSGTASSGAIPIANSQSRSQQHRVGHSFNSSNSVGWVQYRLNENNGRLQVAPSGSGAHQRRQRGRTKGLTPEQRRAAAIMRVVGACSNCKRRKERCDPGIPCKSCVNHYKGDLVFHPCRERTLPDLATVFLAERLGWHPTARSIDRFLGVGNYTVSSAAYMVPLNLGFGPCFPAEVHMVWPNDPNQLLHNHIIYDWPPHGLKHYYQTVFPAVLTDAYVANLEETLDTHLSLLVDDHFRTFPLFRSPLQVLYDIYMLYKQQKEPHARILHQSLKLLVLVHIGGDTSVDATDSNVDRILTSAFGTGGAAIPWTSQPTCAPSSPTPCFIRGQLGRIMPTLALRLMRDVLSRLERMALGRQCAQYPVVLATFGVLLMTVESVQYHAAKRAYHAPYDVDQSGGGGGGGGGGCESVERDSSEGRKLDEQGVEELLNFYRVCYGSCHSRFRSEDEEVTCLVDDLGAVGLGAAEQGGASAEAGTRFLISLKEKIRKTRQYLLEKKQKKMDGAAGEELNGFFDRLLARLFLLSTA